MCFDDEAPPVDTETIFIDGYEMTFASVKLDEPRTIITVVCPKGFFVEESTIRDIKNVAKEIKKLRRAIKRHKKKAEQE